MFYFAERNRETENRSVNEMFKEVGKDDAKKEKRRDEEKSSRRKESKRDDEKRVKKSRKKESDKTADEGQREKPRRIRTDSYDVPPEESMIRQKTMDLDKRKGK